MLQPVLRCPDCSEVHDHTTDLAAVLGLRWEEFVDLFGGGWRVNGAPIAHDVDSDPSGGWDAPTTPWVIAGSPPQLMLRVFYWGVFAAVPRGRGGIGECIYEPGDMVRFHQPFDLGTATEVRRLVTRRRRAIRSCALCWSYVGPEDRFDDRLCHSCASARYGVVY